MIVCVHHRLNLIFGDYSLSNFRRTVVSEQTQIHWENYFLGWMRIQASFLSVAVGGWEWTCWHVRPSVLFLKHNLSARSRFFVSSHLIAPLPWSFPYFWHKFCVCSSTCPFRNSTYSIVWTHYAQRSSGFGGFVWYSCFWGGQSMDSPLWKAEIHYSVGALSENIRMKRIRNRLL